MIIRFMGVSPQLGSDVYVAQNAAIIGDVEIGSESSVWFGACIRGDYGPIRIGDRCSVQDNAVVHVNHTPDGQVFPTRIGSDCVIGHGATVEGCEVGDGCLIGMNAVVLPGARIGSGAVVAAGSVIKEGQIVPDLALVAGTPARIKRQFRNPQPDVSWAAAEYVRLGRKYLETGIILAETANE